MNDLLKLTLEDRAADVSGPHLDVAGLEAAGRRRLRRRRLAGGAGVLALVAVLGVAAPYVVDRAGEDPGQVATDTGPFGEPAVSWVAGRTLHVGETTIELDRAPRAYVLTDAGAVYVADGAVYVADGDREYQVGSSGRSFGRLLVGDGRYAAWYDDAAGEFVAFDVTSSEEVLRVAAEDRSEEFQAPTVVGLDGAAVWLYDERRVMRYDLADPTGIGEQQTAVTSSMDFLAVAGGYEVTSTGRGREVSIVDRAGRTGVVGTVPGDNRADLSPDATYVATDPNDSEQVWDVVTGQDVTPDIGDYDFQAVVRWLSDDTYQALAVDADPRGNVEGGTDFLVCSVSAGDCDLVVDDAVAEDEPLALPIGEALD